MIPQLTPGQLAIVREMCKAWMSSPLVVLLCARRLGKTFVLCAYADFVARHKPGSRIKYAAATTKSVQGFTRPIMEQIVSGWGGELPVWHETRDTWVYPNGSEIVMVGCDEKRKAERLRGPACDLVIVDEAAFIPSLDYVVGTVFRYQLMTRPIVEHGKVVSNTGGGVMVIASSAPESTSHPFAGYVKDAAATGRLIKRTIWESDIYTDAEIQAMCDQGGGPRKTAWRREALCEIITDETSAAVPEMAECKDEKGNWIHVVKRPAVVPAYRWRATVIDGGHVDLLVAALGYVDWQRQVLVIEREVVMQRATSAEIATRIHGEERLAWGAAKPDLRAADFPPQTLADLASHGLHCRAMPKPDKSASVTHLRDLVQARRIEIDPRCVTIVEHVSGGEWAPNRKDWLRKEATAMTPAHHFDGLDAARYLADVADFQTDPRPKPVPFGVQMGARPAPMAGLALLTKGASGRVH